jgi:hypothetical protein
VWFQTSAPYRGSGVVPEPPPWWVRDWLQIGTNAGAGWGDTLGFGIPSLVRRAVGYDGVVNYGSRWYKGGEVVGVVHTVAISWGVGVAKGVGTGLRSGMSGQMGTFYFSRNVPIHRGQSSRKFDFA